MSAIAIATGQYTNIDYNFGMHDLVSSTVLQAHFTSLEVCRGFADIAHFNVYSFGLGVEV
jgi:hypothetical protein